MEWKEYTKLYFNTDSNGYYIGTEEQTTLDQIITEDYAEKSGYYDELYFPHKTSYNNCVS